MSGDETVFYTNNFSLNDHIVELKTPIEDLKSEIRIIKDNKMFIAGLHIIDFDEKGVFGIPYIKFLEAVNDTELLPDSNDTILIKIIKLIDKLFGVKENIDEDIILHEGTKYKPCCGKSMFYYIGSINQNSYSLEMTDFPAKLKTEMLKTNYLISNELIYSSFSSIFGPIRELYKQAWEFKH